MAKKGRPAVYTKQLADALCHKIATSEQGLHAICEESDMPSFKTIFRWLNDPKQVEFRQLYARARELQTEFMGEMLLEIADDGRNDLMTIKHGDIEYEQENKEVSSRSKLRVETRKWLMSKLAPKKYGDKLDVTSGDEPLKNFAPQIIVQKID